MDNGTLASSGLHAVSGRSHAPVAARLLGPFELRVGSTAVPLRSAARRRLLAALLLARGRAVPSEELARAVWDDVSPLDVRNALQAHVWRLRALLVEHGVADGLVETHGSTYRIDPAGVWLDVDHFEATLTAAGAHRRAGRRDQEAADLRRGLATWRGEALTGVGGEVLVRDQGTRLDRLRLDALDACLAADLARGDADGVLDEAVDVLRTHPLDERFWRHRMNALAAGGDRSGALEQYRVVRDLLVRELGVEPGDALQQVHQNLLQGRATGPPAPDQPPRPVWEVRCSLPMDVAELVGRDHEVAAADAAFASPGHRPAVVCFSGQPGIGKSTLAIAVAHRWREQFPDGQWFLRLHTAARVPRPVDDLLDELLSLAQATAHHATLTPEARAAALRAALADRRVLIVLDDAASEAQVRHLLPGTASCGVVVTSRRALVGLRVTYGSHLVTVRPLDDDAARAVLVREIGPVDAGADLTALGRVVATCAGLPLALRIAAANLAARPVRDVTAFADELDDGRLAALEVAEDDQASVRAAFDGAYRGLPPSTQRTFRLVCAVPGQVVPAETIGALCNTTPDAARTDLQRLVREHLVVDLGSGLVTVHDLLRAYGVSVATADDDVHAANGRVLRHAVQRIEAAATTAGLPLRVTGSHTATPATPPSALEMTAARSFLQRWQPILLPLVRAAAEHDDPISWRLADVICGNEALLFINVATCAVLRAALDSAARVGDARTRAVLGLNLSQTLRFLGEIDAAEAVADEVAAAAPSDAALVALAYSEVGGCCWSRGDMTGALRNIEKSAVLAESAGDIPALVRARINRGTALRDLGRVDEAIEAYDAAIAICTPTLGWDSDRATSLAARACTDVGDEARAIAYLRRDRPGDPPWPRILVQASLIVFSRLYAARGDDRRAVARAAEAVAQSVQLSDRHWHLGAVLEHTERLRDAGRHSEALAQVRPVVSEAASGGLGSVEARARVVLAQCALADHRVDTAVAEAEAVLATGGDSTIWTAGDALVVLARAALADGDCDLALRHARAAVTANAPYRFVRPTTRALVALRDAAGAVPAAAADRERAHDRLVALAATTRLAPADLDRP